jgi:outer membrane protein assembly factor BamB
MLVSAQEHLILQPFGESMNRRAGGVCVGLLGIALLLGNTALAQRLEFNWKKEFPKSVSWYVRTSPGILLVKSGKSLTALDGKDGRELWELPDVRVGDTPFAGIPGAERGTNLLEVPGMGILLLNRAELPSGAPERLIALNLMTGERLWDTPPVDELMTAISIPNSGQIVVVSRRPQKKILVAEAAAAAASQVPFLFVSGAIFPYPYRFELERLDLRTGKIEWNEEYPRTFTPGATSVTAFGDHLFIYFGNDFLGCVDLTSGKVLWEDGAKHLWPQALALPLQVANGRLIYASQDVQAIDPNTRKPVWTIEDLGRVSGIFVQDSLTVAIGEKCMSAVDTTSGAERWRTKTHGHTTNLLWDQSSDTLLYMDWKGLHRIERSTGWSLFDAKLQTDKAPYYLRMAGPDAIVAIGYDETDSYNTKSGKLLFAEAKLTGLYRGEAVLDNWPLPENGQDLAQVGPTPWGDEEWEDVRRRTLLSGADLQRIKENVLWEDGSFDVYLTERAKGEQKIWWVDGPTNRQMVIHPTAKQHDVSRPLGNVFAVEGRILWAARIVIN